MTALPVSTGSRAAGLDLSAALQTSTASDTFPPGSDMWLRVKNTTASPITVTIMAAGTVSGAVPGTFLAPLALAPAVPATTGDRLYGPFPAAFADPSDGQVHVSYSASGAGITAGCFNLPD